MSKDYTYCFAWKKRANGEEFVILKEYMSSELNELVRDIHQDLFNCGCNDWIYEQIYYAFDDLKNDKLEDITIEADVYTHDLIQWLNNGYALELCSEVMREYHYDSVEEALNQAQTSAKVLIYEAVNSFIERNQDE